MPKHGSIKATYVRCMRVLAVTCHLHFWQNDRDFLRATVVTDTEIRVSTESRPRRRKFSRRSSRDSNPRPFNHESGALTTELFPPPIRLDRTPSIYNSCRCFVTRSRLVADADFLVMRFPYVTYADVLVIGFP